MKQVISFDLFGRPRSLRMPQGVGIDLRSVGLVTMTRISDVVLDEETQQYKIEFKDRRFINPIDTRTGKPKLFASYEDAVAEEVAIYNAEVKQSTK